MKVLYVGFKGINNASRQLVEKVNSSNKLFLTNSYDGSNIWNYNKIQ